MDYAVILSQAWQIFKRYKALWPFGMLAACGLSYTSSNLDINTPPESAPGRLPPGMAPWLARLEHFFNRLDETQILLLMGAFFLLFVGFSLVIWALSRIGKAGVLRGTHLVAAGQTTLTWNVLWHESLSTGGRLILADLFLWLALLVISLPALLLIIVFTVITIGIGLILLTCLFLPLTLLLKLYVLLVYLELAADSNLGIRAAFGVAWRRFQAHFWHWVGMGLLLGIIGLLLRLVIVIPALLLGFGAWLAFQQGSTLFYLLLLLFIPYFFIAWFAVGLIETYRLIAWTLTHRTLTAPAVQPTTPEEPPASEADAAPITEPTLEETDTSPEEAAASPDAEGSDPTPGEGPSPQEPGPPPEIP